MERAPVLTPSNPLGNHDPSRSYGAICPSVLRVEMLS